MRGQTVQIALLDPLVSALASATVGTPLRLALFERFCEDPTTVLSLYKDTAARSYGMAVPLGIFFTLLWLSTAWQSIPLTPRRSSQYAFYSTFCFWTITGYAALVFKHAPCNEWFWCFTTLVCGLLSALTASELCTKALDLLNLLDPELPPTHTASQTSTD